MEISRASDSALLNPGVQELRSSALALLARRSRSISRIAPVCLSMVPTASWLRASPDSREGAARDRGTHRTALSATPDSRGGRFRSGSASALRPTPVSRHARPMSWPSHRKGDRRRVGRSPPAFVFVGAWRFQECHFVFVDRTHPAASDAAVRRSWLRYLDSANVRIAATTSSVTCSTGRLASTTTKFSAVEE